MRRISARFWLTAFLFAALNVHATADFEAGIGVREITPQTGEVMWGYTNRTAPAEGALDPLMTRVAAFRVGDQTVALVTLDLGRPPLPASCDRVRARVQSLGVDQVIFSASHTHQAPAVDFEMPYLAPMEDAICEAIAEAVSDLKPAMIGVGRTQADIGHNRRFVLEDGTCRMLWRNEERIPTGPVDREVGIVKIEGADGSLKAVIVHYACHPVVLGDDHTQYSADWVGAMSAAVKDATGAECLFVNGGCGDINPYLDKSPVAEGGVAAMQLVGREVADAVVGALGGIDASEPAEPSLAVREERIEVGLRWDKSNPANEKLLRGIYGPLYELYIAPLPQDLHVPLLTLILNNDLALVGMPGEIFVQYQLDLKEKSPVANTFLLGYTNEYHAYFPTVKAASEGGYGASVQTYVGLGAADLLLSRALANIAEMTGQVTDVMSMADFVMREPTPEELARD